MAAARWRAAVAAGVLGLGLAACGGDGAAPGASRAVVVDSGGVRIVEHPAGAFADTLGPPVMVLGREGDAALEFYQVVELLPLASGNLVVVNAGTAELRFFAPDGTHLRTVGRRGDGPAEFGFVSAAWVGPGDTLRINDSRRQRVVFFDSAGAFVRGESYGDLLPPRPPDGSTLCFFPGLAGLLGDGTPVIREWGCMDFEGSDGVRNSPQALSVAGPEGSVPLGRWVATTVWERGRFDQPLDQYALLPLAPRMAWIAGGDRVSVTGGDRFDIQRFDAQGRLRERFRVRDDAPPVTEADRAAHRAALAAEDRSHPEDVPYPERRGAWDALLLAADGSLWARSAPPPGADSESWTVFSPDGASVRRVVVEGMALEAVRNGLVYGVRTDDLGIQQVVVLDAGPSHGQLPGR